MRFDDILGTRGGARWPAFALELLAIGAAYFALAKGGLLLASIHPSATPIWPPTGLVLASVLLRGYRVWPAIFIAAFLANATTAGTPVTAIAIAAGNTLEGVVGAWLINRWAAGCDSYATPVGVARFALLCLPATAVSATVGVLSLALAGFAAWPDFGPIWLTWWLGDLAGALVVTPVIVLWALGGRPALGRDAIGETALVLAAACAVGVIAFSPLVGETPQRHPLGFLAIVPLLWAALRTGPRDTATAALVLSAFAVWGTLAGGGPFWHSDLNNSFLNLLMFMIATAVPSLALSADVAVRKRTEANLRAAQRELDERIRIRTAALTSSNLALSGEVEHRRRVETELDDQRLYLLEAQRLANLGSWVWEVADNKVTWSDQLIDIYGLTAETFEGTFEAYLKLVHEDDRERVRAEIMRAFEQGRGFRIDERIVRPDGAVRHLQSIGEVIKDETGRVVRMLGVCQDVTERKQAEQALRETQEKLAQAHKIEALGQLTGGIAHDFNNILMIVSGRAEMIRRQLTDPKALQGVDAIMKAAQRGESLTRQLLTFSRRQPLSPVVVDLKERVQAVRDMLGSSLRGNITLAVDVPFDIWPVEVDIAELELALVNVAVNARDAMPDGGTFTLKARNVAAQPGRSSNLLPGDYVELSLADTGTGIPPDVIAKIFDPFFTTKAVGKGTGLGLSQVYGFAQQSRGTVSVKSEPGRGTEIVIALPRSHSAVAQDQDEGELPQPRLRHEGQVLVVEDNPDVGDVTAALLGQLGYKVARAENADDALRILENGPAFDLVFSDIVMPNGINGIHLAQEVRARYPAVGVLLTTGYSDVALTAQAQFPILRKPFELTGLQRAVADALNRRRRAAGRAAGGGSGSAAERN
jgi:PAS domain S-box-containing protein